MYTSRTYILARQTNPGLAHTLTRQLAFSTLARHTRYYSTTSIMNHPRLDQLKDKHLFKTKAYIDGAWVDARDGSVFSVTDPSTGKEFGTVPEMNVDDTRDAIKAATRAFASWSKTSAQERYRVLNTWGNLILEHKEDLATIMTIENGKSYSDALKEVVYAQSFIEWFAEEAKRIYGDIIPASVNNQRALVIRQPVGVCGIITPWNFPSAMLTRKAGAALAAGCTVVSKPASETPYSALALAELAERAGIPKGVLNIVTTHAHVKDVGKELSTNKDIRKVSFTGSTAVGKIIMELCASTMKRVSLELGGNAPFIIFDDADPEKAVKGLMSAKMRNTAQVCIAPNRIYVQAGIHDAIANLLKERVEKLRVGSGFTEGVTVGPLISKSAQEKVNRHIDDAIKRGARVLFDGRQRRLDNPEYEKGFFVQPTLVSDTPPDALVNNEETFGPLIALSIFKTEEEAIRLANATDAGLAAYIYTNDLSRTFRVAEALESGMVSVNGASISNAATPFGGVKESGIGREGSKYGLEEYVEKKLIAIGIKTSPEN